MVGLALVTAARLAALATGRGGLPTSDEWPMVAALLALVAVFGARLLMGAGLTKLEACCLSIGSPLLVVFDAPLGSLSPTIGLAANVSGCLLPVAVGLKVLATRRYPALEAFVVMGVGIVIAFFSSHVVPDRGVLLSYRIPALVVGVVAAALFVHRPDRAGAIAFAAGGIGVLLGADVLRLGELAGAGGAGRVILGGAGILDGIFLVALLSGCIATCVATIARFALATRHPARGAA